MLIVSSSPSNSPSFPIFFLLLIAYVHLKYQILIELDIDLCYYVSSTVDEETGYGNIFSLEAGTDLGRAKSLFESVWTQVVDGTITVARLRRITHRECSKQFEELHKSLRMRIKTPRSVDVDISTLLEIRLEELRALDDNKKYATNLLEVCRSIREYILGIFMLL